MVPAPHTLARRTRPRAVRQLRKARHIDHELIECYFSDFALWTNRPRKAFQRCHGNATAALRFVSEAAVRR